MWLADVKFIQDTIDHGRHRIGSTMSGTWIDTWDQLNSPAWQIKYTNTRVFQRDIPNYIYTCTITWSYTRIYIQTMTQLDVISRQ